MHQTARRRTRSAARMATRTAVLALLATVFVAAPAWAHPGHLTGDLTSGLLHPLTGLDHLLAMVAVGLWAGHLGGRARLALPGAFVVALLAGAALALGGVALPAVEAGISVSVLVLGLLLVTLARAPLGISGPLVAVFALAHGHAHGAELGAASAGPYIVGFTASTVALHALGLLLAHAARRPAGPLLTRVAGLATAVAGALLWAHA